MKNKIKKQKKCITEIKSKRKIGRKLKTERKNENEKESKT